MTEVYALGAASMQIGIALFSRCEVVIRQENFEQYVLLSFRIAPANIQKDLDNEQIISIFLRKKTQIVSNYEFFKIIGFR